MKLLAINSLVLSVLLLLSSMAYSTMVFFDNSGAEMGITTIGTTDFSFNGSNWSGGTVNSVGISRFYGSFPAAYMLLDGTAEISFDYGATDVSFFFVHDGDNGYHADAFDKYGRLVGSVDSNPATEFADPANFVSFSTTTAIESIAIYGGIIDNFAYTNVPSAVPVPATIWLFASALGCLVARKKMAR